MEDRHVQKCCGHHHGGNNGNNSTPSILRIYNPTSSIVAYGANLPLTLNTIFIPNNNDFTVDLLSNVIFFAPGIYSVTFTITASIPLAPPITTPLTIYENNSGFDGLRLSASVYNLENIATVSGSTMYTSIDSNNYFSLVNRTFNDVGVPIELFYLEITAFKVYTFPT